MASVVETVQKEVEPLIEAHHFELVDIEFVKEGKSWYLRVYIDKPGGITIEDCAMASDQISEKLDSLEPDPFPQAYFLEVSSPGAERPIKTSNDWEKAVGKYIHISLYAPIDGQKVFEGTLEDYSGSTISLSYMDKTRKINQQFELKQIGFARFAIKF
ncbi:ribosome maturation factor RimP [Pediococcus cellicola]|uniref:ribosome maturation factor RimP n=1 Tax=Pediococcus cellicola TaxID=319652 RepID=UPI00070C9BE4|nr:ribosome maturation factor RimP [Pediococcus cellicola]GEL14480.1 ribosome maturation factor RimP [Pediococcus cellicola]